MSAERTVYLDSSALVKLVVREAESDALLRYLGSRPVRVSCGLARVEVIRAVQAHGRAALARARQLLERISLLHLDELLLDQAAVLDGAILRSLDAIHLAAARTLGEDLDELVTYDNRMADAARRLDILVSAPV
jgi:uncharacterized protein